MRQCTKEKKVMQSLKDDSVGEAIREIEEFEGKEETGRSNMLTPDQLRELMEKEAKRENEVSEEVSEVAEPEKNELVEQAPELNLEELQRRVEAGEELSEEEQRALDELEKRLEESEKAKPAIVGTLKESYNVAGKEYTPDEIVERMRVDLELEPTDKVTAKMVDVYVRALNRNEQQRRVEERAAEVAAQRKQNLAMRLELESKARDLERREREYQTQYEKLKQLASLGIKKEDLYDEETQTVDEDKRRMYYRQEDAKEQLRELEAQREQIRQQQKEVQAQIERETVAGFVAGHPEYATKEPLHIVAKKIEEGAPVDPEDKLKVLELVELLDSAFTKGVTMDEIHALRQRQGTLAITAEAQPQQSRGAQRKPTNNIAERIRKLRERAKKLPTYLGEGSGTGAERGMDSKKRLAVRMIEQNRNALRDYDDPELRKLGY